MIRPANFSAHNISIGKLVVQCPAPIEPVHLRLRVSHLLQSVDFTPPGFPPQAILVVHRAALPEPMSLASFRLRSECEQQVRAEIDRLYRLAVRPERGFVRAGAEAVLFADIGEWLACLGIAAQAQTLEHAWYWRASLPSGAASSSLKLSRVWASTARFVPAAVAHLSEWGRVAEVLKLFSPQESNAVYAALSEEWNLPSLRTPGIARTAQQTLAAEKDDKRAATTVAMNGDVSRRKAKLATAMRAAPQETGSSSPSTNRNEPVKGKGKTSWLPTLPELLKPCEQMPLETQRLVATAIALFQAPARARSADFAAELERCLLGYSTAGRRQPANLSPASIESTTSVSPGNVAPERAPNELLPVDAPARTDRQVPTTKTPAVDRIKQRATVRIEEVPSRIEMSSGAEPEPPSPIEIMPARLWGNLSGYQTRIGGVLFLVNLIEQTGLPDCFEENFELSRHISGWGLLELLGKTLLGPMSEDFREDPLWAVLALLDGREPGETAGASLPDIDSYRMPAAWLKRFVAMDEPWTIGSSLDRFNLYHRSGAFTIVDCPKGASSVAEQAAIELERYRTQGVAANSEQGEFLDADSSRSTGLSLRLTPEWSNLPRSMQRWMRWTFPFLQYLLVRAFAGQVGTSAALANLLLVKTGTLYYTATHVDLVMAMDQINLPVRCAGLDANPGWVPALSRVISFHFEES